MDPTCVTQAVERLGLRGHLLMTHQRDWLLWKVPQLKTHLTFEYVAGQERWAEWEAARQAGLRGLLGYAERYAVQVLILPTGLRPDVSQFPDWTIVHLENRLLVMVRRPASSPGYHLIRPWENARQVLEEATRALQQCPDGATFAWAYKANALRLLGHHEEERAAARLIPQQLVLQ
jgi:hypothetical protein